MENLDFVLNEVFNTVLERRQLQGSFTQEEYVDLVEEVLEEKRELGEIDDDDDLNQAKEALEARWPEVSELGSSTSAGEEAEEGLS